jgi:hypothetical protein
MGVVPRHVPGLGFVTVWPSRIVPPVDGRTVLTGAVGAMTGLSAVRCDWKPSAFSA